MDAKTKKRAETRLRLLTGQIAGIQRMVTDERGNAEVLTQIAAVQAALAEVGRIVLSHHLAAGLTEALSRRDLRQRGEKVDELLDIFFRFTAPRRTR
jgi:DNA-binding FrmR family transcriptional regulator